ncbi:type II TA system antitoxin MqsA family protein [Haloferula sargassicola]|uniref:IrrE N-terminal-like domain-containing protein n=1 Tax=Haloferula sargassicola TaxID=490096 RepID=A0ABP9UQY1_9BACT
MKTIEQNPKAEAAIPCFECESGKLIPELTDYETEHPKLGKLTIPDVPVLVCDHCGDRVLGDEGNRRIDAYLDKALNVVTPEEIQVFLGKYGLTQKEASRITGFGEKNISRWAAGRSRPSESVSNMFRLLLADESVFERLRQKNFDGTTVSMFPAEERQPDDEEKPVLKEVDYPALANLGLVKPTQSPREKRSELCAFAKTADLKEFRTRMTESFELMAAFKDTSQKFSPVSAGLWSYVGERLAAKVETEPYDREKLHEAVDRLRELTQHPLEQVVADVRRILAQAGVALVFVPIFKESALRGSTRLLTPGKALIIHGLKYRSLSQFWIILFHEIAHLLLHIEKPGEVITDYEDQRKDPKERAADEWAYDRLVSRDRELEFVARHPKPAPWQLEQYAKSLKVHPAIAAEILNTRSDSEAIAYGFLKKRGLFPHLSKEQTRALLMT